MVEFGMHEVPSKALDMKATGAALRAIRTKKKIKVGDIARHLNTSSQSIYNWENGEMIKLDHIVALCAFLGVSVDQLIKTKDEMVVYCDYDD
ncbi:MAG: helix-turn-helix domain-containing protein [Treponema sp.]|nr:helix-turn-helix domain-containing protein [Treponema sp.]